MYIYIILYSYIQMSSSSSVHDTELHASDSFPGPNIPSIISSMSLSSFLCM